MGSRVRLAGRRRERSTSPSRSASARWSPGPAVSLAALRDLTEDRPQAVLADADTAAADARRGREATGWSTTWFRAGLSLQTTANVYS